MDLQAHNFSTVRKPGSSCLVCDEPLHHHRVPGDLADPVCPSPHCRQISRRRADLPPSVFVRLVEIHRRHQREQRARAEDTARKLSERRAIEARENLAIREQVQTEAS